MSHADNEAQVNPVLIELAKKIRMLYILERRNFETLTTGCPSKFGESRKSMVFWDGGVDSRGVKHKNIWLRIARFVLANSVSPENLVKALFLYHEHNDPPKPNLLLTTKNLELARDLQSRGVEDLKIQYKHETYNAMQKAIELQTIKPDLPESEIWKIVALSSDVELSPLMRYYIAYSTKNYDVAESYFQAALIQYLNNWSQYRDFLGDKLPKQLSEKAKEILTKETVGSGDGQ